MSSARWTSVFVCLGLACACTAGNGQTRQPQEEEEQPTVSSAFTEFVAPGERLTSAAIVLQDDSNGACVKADDGIAPVYTKKGRTVRWVIVNNCTATVKIQLQFAPWPGNFNPFSSLIDSCSALSGHTCTPIPKAVVKQTGPQGSPNVVVYPYTILVNGHPLEPEVVIEWF